ncbi:MAG TPA: GntR family transcriptional regulator [Actinomycetota bacterium]|nr:GntR family transcriptional regulator [Actinomycetota bacterium]
MDTGLNTDLYTAGSAAYLRLKGLILQGDVPIGVRLREARIAERLEISRTPVREALMRLYAERFLERHPEGGYRVTAPSVQTLRQLYEVRRALELWGLAASIARGKAAMTVLEELFQEWRDIASEVPAPDPELVLIDEDFHQRLAQASGNGELCVELQRVNERIRPVRSHDFLTKDRIAATIDEHLSILEATLRQDQAGAHRLLDDHIKDSQDVVETAVVGALEKMLVAERGGPAW